MATELNILINEETAKRIKEFAENNNTSISNIAEEQFDKLTLSQGKKAESFVEKSSGSSKPHFPNVNTGSDEYLKDKKSFVERTAGIVKDLTIDDINAVKEEYIKKKYGL